MSPATPLASLPRAAIVPETWVPCPLPSWGCASLVDEVPAVDVVDAAVAVVVEAVRLAPAARLARVGPHVGGEVRMGRIDPGVDHGDGHLGRAGRDVPGLGRADGGHVPLVGEQRVVRRGGLAHDPIGLGVDHAVHVLEVRDGGADADARRGIDELEPAHGERRVALDVCPRAHVGALLRRRIGGEADDHARDGLRAGGRRPSGLGRSHACRQGQQHSQRRDDPCRPGRHPAP